MKQNFVGEFELQSQTHRLVGGNFSVPHEKKETTLIGWTEVLLTTQPYCEIYEPPEIPELMLP